MGVRSGSVRCVGTESPGRGRAVAVGSAPGRTAPALPAAPAAGDARCLFEAPPAFWEAEPNASARVRAQLTGETARCIGSAKK